jgi:hypothetical protein
MEKVKYRYVGIITTLGFLLGVSALLLTQDIKAEDLAPNQSIKPQIKDEEASKKAQETQKVVETPIENVTSVTADQLVDKPQDYLNKNVKFTAPFFAFSNLALDYKPAFRSSRTYLSFLLLRSNGHTPFSEIKLAMLIPKEKDPQTKLLGTLKEGDTVEITGHVFACSLDEPWLDVLRLKKIASAKKAESSEDKAADEKDSSAEDSPSEK